MRLAVVDIKGKKISTVTVADKAWAAPVNQLLVAQAVQVYRSNQRQAGAVVKTRGEVRGSRRKIWRQKGTGRARHGDRYAPIFVGGGVAHGPTGKENYRKSMNKKMRRKALWVSLSDRVRQNLVTVIDKWPVGLRKTKELEAILTKLGGEAKVLLVIDEPKVLLFRAARNLAGAKLLLAHQLNAGEVLKHQRLVLTKRAVEKIEAHFGPGKKEES